MEQFKEIVGVTGYAIEGFGVLVIIIGTLVATILFLGQVRHDGIEPAYRRYRRSLGRSIILGLEFLIAGDIIRTVIVEETLANVGVLALIILMRAFLSFTLHLEVEGRWPWQSGDPA